MMMMTIVHLRDWWRGDVSTYCAPQTHSFGTLWLELSVNDDDDDGDDDDDDDDDDDK